MSPACGLSQAQNQSFIRWITRILLLVAIILQYTSTIVSSSSLSHAHYETHAARERDQPGRSGELPLPSDHLLQNQCSHRHVRFLRRKKLDAKGQTRDRYSELQLTSVSFDGLLYIQNAKTKHYLCFNKKGKLKVKHTMDDQCIFKETPVGTSGEQGYTYQSHKYTDFFLGFNKNGKKLKGTLPRSKKRQVCYTFLKSDSTRTFAETAQGHDLIPGPNGNFHDLHHPRTGRKIRHSRHKGQRRRSADVT